MKKKFLILVIIIFWVFFPLLSFLNWNSNFFNWLLGSSLVSTAIYLSIIPIFFSVILGLILFKSEKQEKKLFIFGIVVPLSIWFLIVVLPLVLFYFFGFSGK